MIATWGGVHDLLASGGVELDPSRNEAHRPRITTDVSRVPICVMPTDEERMIAQHTLRMLRDPG